MTATEILTQLQQHNPDALLLEPREVYDKALVGVTSTPDDRWPRTNETWVAVYDEELCLKAIMEWQGCDYAEASEWFGYNTSGAWAGEGTPTFRSIWDHEE